jgi:hypothetical protein
MLLETTRATFQLLRQTLEGLDDAAYALPVQVLSGASIGEHVRHMLDMYLCLLDGMEQGVVCYEKRRRDRLVETSRTAGLSLLRTIEDALEKPDRTLVLENRFGQEERTGCRIPTSYLRELACNLEHTIHHMALIRIGIESRGLATLPPDFGVAPSTLRYRGQLHR